MPRVKLYDMINIFLFELAERLLSHPFINVQVLFCNQVMQPFVIWIIKRVVVVDVV